jgi:tetratricopeptide (TPR) repeat protein
MSSAADQAIARARELGGGGDLVTAEAIVRAALAADKRFAPLHAELAQIVAAQGRDDEAETALRAAIAVDPLYAPAAYSLSQGLLGMGHAAEALEIVLPLTRLAKPDAGALSLQAQALKALGRIDEALHAFRDAAAADQSDPSHQHNLAVALEEADLNVEASRAARAARARGLDIPETWLVEGRTLVRQDRFDEAETAFRELLRRTPDYPTAYRELGQLIWMRTGDAAAATADVDKAILAHPGSPLLRVVQAKILEYAGDPQAGYAVLRDTTAVRGLHPEVELAASQIAIEFDPQAALLHAERADGLSPDHPLVLSVLAEANLAAGRPEAALKAAQRLKTLAPFNQHALALEATAWRLLGDPRAAALNDYATLVRPGLIDTPPGWSSLETYLADLAAALDRLHRTKAHPIGQSLRGGTQTQQNLRTSTDPAIAGFFRAIDGPIRRAMAALGQGEDPVRSRNTGDYRLSGSWSVNLRPGGHHVDHLHPAGWLSSACYIDLPPAIEGEGREGWLRFGKSGIPTDPTLEAEHWVKPEPGLLVLFPSYMWHGTQPFGGDQRRLTVAFDVVPA